MYQLFIILCLSYQYSSPYFQDSIDKSKSYYNFLFYSDSPLDYELTKDGRLEIPNFRSEDATVYTCEYRINDVLVGRQIISFSQSPIITPQPPTVLPTPSKWKI